MKVRIFLCGTLALASVSAWACSTVVVGKKASATGRVIVGHNEDDVGELSVIHGLVPRARWRADDKVPAETGCARIPQISLTRGFYWSEVRSAESGLSSADIFLNDAGVLVVSNNGNGGGPEDAASGVTDGGLKYVLRRAVAERASSARDAVDVITNLVMTWGYACPGRIYTVADKDEAWLVEIVKGRRFVARRCPDDAVAVVPNCYTIRGLETGDIVSPDIAAQAAKEPSFDISETFQRADRKNSAKDIYRWRHMLRLSAEFDGASDLPFAFVPRQPVGAEAVRAALSTHFEGTADEVLPHHGPEAAACGRTAVCRDSTVESTICVFGPDISTHELQVATGAPCQTPFVSFRPFAEGLPAAMDRSSDAAVRLEGHFRPVIPLKAGFSRVDITPEPGILMPGYFKVRESKGVLDPLEANCLAFSDGTTLALVAVIDCVDMPDAFADEAREAIAAKTGIDKGAIFVHATHTHAGGDLRRTNNRLLGPEAAAAKKRLSDAYARKTVAALADAAARAVADLKPAHLSCGRSAARRISFGRRYRMKDGSVRTNPGVLNPDIVGAAGNPPDEEVQLLRIDREGADPIAVLNFQTHPDVIGGERFSADWPGFARRTFEASLEGRVRCLLMNGTEGDVNHVCVDPTPEEQKGLHPDFDDVPRGYAHARHMGATIAAAALQVWHKTTTLEAGKIRFGGKTVYVPSNRPRPDEMEEARRIDALHRAGRDAELPYKGMDLTTKVAAAERKIRLEHGPDSFELPLSAFAIGSSVAFGGFPGEPFNDIGKAVKKGSPFKMTILACLTNGDRGYFPFSDSYKEGGYESESSPFGPSVADDLIAGLLKLLNGLRSDGARDARPDTAR